MTSGINENKVSKWGTVASAVVVAVFAGVLRGVSERGRGARVYRERQRKDLRGHRRHGKDLGFYSGLVRSHWGPLQSECSFDASSTASPIFPQEVFEQGIENRHIIPF